jgi:hypothetical protein
MERAERNSPWRLIALKFACPEVWNAYGRSSMSLWVMKPKPDSVAG